MKLEKNARKIKCEMGVCKNNADYVIKLNRVGIRSNLYICSNCLKELYALAGAEIVPKSVETAKERVKKNAN